MDTLVKAINEFSVDLYKRLPPTGNLFFSPFSISIALSILLLGARNKSADALGNVLHIGQDAHELKSALRDLLNRVSSIEAEEPQWDETTGEAIYIRRKIFELHAANGLFPHASRGRLVEDFKKAVVGDLGAALVPVDFSLPESAADSINLWTSEQTRGLIDQLVSPEMFSELTRLVLVNTIYFFAEWETQFSEYATRDEPFHTGPDTSVPVDMMHATLTLAYNSDQALGAEIISIPYREAEMLVLLPHDGKLSALEKNLSALDEAISGMKPRLIALSLPKFTCETSLELGDVLQSMGLGILFDPVLADLSGISADAEGLNLSAVVHQARIKVDENGTEAAAATAIMLAAGCAATERPVPFPFVVDRPFVYLIRDRQSGANLFAGRMTKP